MLAAHLGVAEGGRLSLPVRAGAAHPIQGKGDLVAAVVGLVVDGPLR